MSSTARLALANHVKRLAAIHGHGGYLVECDGSDYGFDSVYWLLLHVNDIASHPVRTVWLFDNTEVDLAELRTVLEQVEPQIGYRPGFCRARPKMLDQSRQALKAAWQEVAPFKGADNETNCAAWLKELCGDVDDTPLADFTSIAQEIIERKEA